MRPWYQRVVVWVSYAALGFSALGALLDSISNAMSLITPARALVGSAILVLGWAALEFAIRKHPLTWIGKDGKPLRVIGLGLQSRLALAGALLLLWTPTIVSPDKTIAPAEKQTTAALPTKTIPSRNVIYVGFDVSGSAFQPSSTVYHREFDEILQSMRHGDRLFGALIDDHGTAAKHPPIDLQREDYSRMLVLAHQQFAEFRRAAQYRLDAILTVATPSTSTDIIGFLCCTDVRP